MAFADLVDFTKLGESVDPGRLGAVAAQLEELTRDVVRRPVRLVKTIGDEVMLESSDTAALLDAALDLLDAADGQDDEFPQIAVGIARGQAISRGGDWFGHSGEPGQPGHRHRAAGQRPGDRGGQGRGRRGRTTATRSPASASSRA